MTVEETLVQRGSVYGDFKDQVACVSGIVSIMKTCAHKNSLEVTIETLAEWHYLAIKLARIAANPIHVDSYHDLAGYALLMEKERLKLNGNELLK